MSEELAVVDEISVQALMEVSIVAHLAATMSSTAEKLEDKGLITLARCPKDGRQRRIAITPQGREVRAQGIAAQLALIERYNDFVTDEQWGELAQVLGKIRKELEAATR
jgi:DNA-binding MarR family transcriptional regulator